MIIRPGTDITVIEQYASEYQYGICPKLYDDIRILSAGRFMLASEYEVPHEEAIKTTIDSELLVPDISGVSFSGGQNIFQENIDRNTMTFNSLYLSGDMYLVSGITPNIGMLTTDRLCDPGEKKELTNLVIGGGIYHETVNAKWSDFDDDADENFIILPFRPGYVLGKVIVRLREPWSFPEDEDKFTAECLETSGDPKVRTTFSIGTGDDEKETIVKKFTTPRISGELIPIEYGTYMYDKVEYVERDYFKGIYNPFGDNFGSYDLIESSDWVLDGVGFYIDQYRWGEFFQVTPDFENRKAIEQLSAAPYLRDSGNAIIKAAHFYYKGDRMTHDLSTFIPKNHNWVIEFKFLFEEAIKNRFRIYSNDSSKGDFEVVITNNTFSIKIAPNTYISPTGDDPLTFTVGTWNTVRIISCNTQYYSVYCGDSYIGTYRFISNGLRNNFGTVSFEQVDWATRTHVSQVYIQDLSHLYILENAQLPESKKVKLYRWHGTNDTKGQLDVVLFYDKYKITNNLGHKITYFGGRNNDTYLRSLEIFDFDNTSMAFINGNMSVGKACQATLASGINSSIFCVFGIKAQDKTSYSFYDTSIIEKFDSVSLTHCSIYNNTATTVFRAANASTYTNGYLFGGYQQFHNNHYLIGSGVQKFDFASETFSYLNYPISSGGNTTDAIAITDTFTNNEIYIIGGKKIPINGKNDIELDDFTDNVEKFNVHTNIYTKVNEIFFNVEGPMAVQEVDKIWVVGGIDKYNDTSSNHNYGDPINVIQSINIITNTPAVKATAKLVIPRAFGNAEINIERTKAYFAGGGDLNLTRTSPYQTNIIEIFDFITDVNCIKCTAKLVLDRIGLGGARV